MALVKIAVKPRSNGTVEIHIVGRDDAGHLLNTFVSSPDLEHVASVVSDTLRSLQTVASEITEEEGFEDKTQ